VKKSRDNNKLSLVNYIY